MRDFLPGSSERNGGLCFYVATNKRWLKFPNSGASCSLLTFIGYLTNCASFGLTYKNAVDLRILTGEWVHFIKDLGSQIISVKMNLNKQQLGNLSIPGIV